MPSTFFSRPLSDKPQSASPLYKPRAVFFALSTISALCALVVSSAAHAQSAEKKDKKDEGPWNVSAGLFVSSSPEYEGGKKSVVSVLPDINVSYRTKDSIRTNTHSVLRWAAMLGELIKKTVPHLSPVVSAYWAWVK
jgi:hypothetical protein